MSRAVQAVTSALLPLAAEHIQFPASRQAMSDIQEYFLTHYHIPQVIGVIDGTLIPISTPSVDGHIYIYTVYIYMHAAKVIQQSTAR